MKPSFLRASLPATFLSIALAANASIERPIERTFPTAPGATVLVNISGGSIVVKVGEPGGVALRVEQTLNVSTDAEADKILADYEIIAETDGNTVKFVTKSRRSGSGWFADLRGQRLRQKVFLTVPTDTDLDLDTSGGSIKVEGETSGSLRADTSGGSITIEASNG